MEAKGKLNEWMRQNLKYADYEELGIHGHILLGISQKTWYNYRTSKTTRITADIAAKFNKELINRGYEAFEF